MRYTFFEEPDFELDSLTLLSALASGGSVVKLCDTLVEKYANGDAELEARIRGLIAEADETEQYVRVHMNYEVGLPSFTGREAFEFLYRERDAVKNLPASAFYFHGKLKELGVDNKLPPVLIYLDEESLVTKGDFIDWPVAADDAEVFARIDKCGGGADIKYEAMRLYYRFEEYYEYYLAITEQAVRLMADKLYLYEDKIKKLHSDVDGILAVNGNAALKEKWGIEIPDDDNVPLHVRPSLYMVNGITFMGLMSPQSPLDVLWGVSMTELNEIIDNARPPSENLPEFLKAISDNTKWSILQLLKKEPLYGGQLAEQLGLTGATISHHMDALKKLEVILYRKESTKLYYSLNEEMIDMYMKLLGKELKSGNV